MGSIVHRSVPTNLKWFPTCSHAHAMFQDRFKDVQVGSRWFSTLYILSPNFHTAGFNETILFGYAADGTPLPTYICLPSGLYRSRTGRIVEKEGRYQEIISLPGIFFFDGWRVQPSLVVPANVPQTQDVPDTGTPRAKAAEDNDETRQPEEEARNILAAAYKNQAENGPSTRRAAIRACKYLKVLVERHGKVIHKVHMAAREHTQQSKRSAASKQQQQPAGGTLPKITPELTSELLHCLNAIPDPWPMAKISIDMEKPAQWVTKMCRLYFADIYARRTEGIPKAHPAPGVEATLQEVQRILPDLEAKMIEFLAEWIVTLLSPATQIVKARAPHLAFMFVKEYWFREFYLGLKVTASLGRDESYTQIIDGQVRCITQEHIQKRGQLIWNVEFLTIFVPAWMFFFSSSLAVNALWHGPDNDISGEKGGTQRNWPVPVKMANHHTKPQQHKQRRPANPPARLAFRLQSNKATRRTGPGPTKNNHK